METRRIGSLEVSVVGLGCNNFGWRLDADATSEVVSAALDAGISFFDAADAYGGTQSEEFLGRALRQRRDEAMVATTRRRRCGSALEAALEGDRIFNCDGVGFKAQACHMKRFSGGIRRSGSPERGLRVTWRTDSLPRGQGWIPAGVAKFDRLAL